MPYNDGSLTKREQIAAWRAGGRVGPHPWPQHPTAAQVAVRQQIDDLMRELKRGPYAPRVLSDSEIEERALRNRLRRAAVIQSGIQRARRGPTQIEIANDWLMRGKPADEPVPRLVQQRAAALVRSNAKQAKLRALRRAERGPQEQQGGRPDLPLDAVAGARLLCWFAIWDACTVPDEFKADDVRYGVPAKVDWQRVPVPGVGRWPVVAS